MPSRGRAAGLHPTIPAPPADRLPAPVADAVRAAERHARGGPPPSVAQTAALVELTSWAFHGVAPGHEAYEDRLSAWIAGVQARHGARAAS